jgi:hydroxymethylpyrimidine pyrophosphatase-like HAD family hydrolase
MSPQPDKTGPPIKLLIADVDGTLVTGAKLLTDGACRAVERLRGAGIELAITSGRPPRGMAMLVEPLALTTPIAAFNGGMFVKPDLTTALQQSTLPLEVAREVLDFLLHAGLDAWVYRDADWFIRAREAPHVAPPPSDRPRRARTASGRRGPAENRSGRSPARARWRARWPASPRGTSRRHRA